MSALTDFLNSGNISSVPGNAGSGGESTFVATGMLRQVMQDVNSSLTLNVKWFNAKGDGKTDDTLAIATAMLAAYTGGYNLLFPSGNNYKITSPILQQVAADTTITAYGATFTCTHDGIAFDLNPNQVFDGSDTTTIRHVRWEGGYFINTNVTKTASIAIKAWQMRGFQLDGIRFQNFFKNVSIAGKDTYLISRCIFSNASGGYDIYHPTDAEMAANTTGGSVLGGDLPLMIMLDKNYHSGFPVSHLFMGTKISTFVSRDCSYNGAATGTKCYFRDSSILYGEGYTFDGCHFETSIAGQQNVLFEDLNAQGFYVIKFTGCTIGGGGIGWKGLKFQRCRRVEIGPNVFRDGTGGNTEEGLNFDANCVDFTVAQTCEFIGPFATPLIVSASVSRDRYSLLPSYRTAAVVVTGYNGVVVSTGNATITMSSAISTKWPTYGIPKGYMLSLLCLDSGSAVAASNRVAVQTTSGGVTNNALRVDLPGAPNSSRRMMAGYVAADANGDIYIDYIASGVGTLTIILFVQAIIM